MAYHLHSFSAVSVKNPKQWVCALLQRGASVTAGNVAEPYLGGCLDPEIFFARLLLATPWRKPHSWQPHHILAGRGARRPLYRPFAARKSAGAADNAFARWYRACRDTGADLAALEGQVVSNLRKTDGAVVAEAFAWHCAEINRLEKAADYFRMAAELSSTPVDWTRNTLLQITVNYNRGEKRLAEAQMNRMLEQTLGSPTARLLRKPPTLWWRNAARPRPPQQQPPPRLPPRQPRPSKPPRRPRRRSPENSCYHAPLHMR